MGIKPKKGLGQHFLRDFAVAQRIALSVDVLAPAQLLEIGPGEGVLTELLLPKYPQLSVIEIDSESVDHLRRAYPSLGERLHYDDFLKWTFPVGHWVIIGNFPYNISSQIIFRAIEQRSVVDGLVGMFQKEVAERIAAGPGSKTYGILSVLTQSYFDVEYLFTVDASAFHPPPKVQSGVIRLKRKTDYEPDCDEKFLFSIVKAAFNQRRKMLRNSVKAYLNESNMDAVEPYLTKRPEQLSFQDFAFLAKQLKP
jgi:16S rRNA (adenine1518-N6/adenine1519-N6)-dimethyltransferase